VGMRLEAPFNGTEVLSALQKYFCASSTTLLCQKTKLTFNSLMKLKSPHGLKGCQPVQQDDESNRDPQTRLLAVDVLFAKSAHGCLTKMPYSRRA